MSLIFCDLNKSLCNKIRKLDLKQSKLDIQIHNMDIFKVHKKYKGSKICTASNPKFNAGGGLDKLLSTKYPEEWKQAKEFNITENLMFLISVDSSIYTNTDIIKRAMVGVWAYARRGDLILTGIGTAIGGFDEDDFLKIFEQMFVNADLSYANLSNAKLSNAKLINVDLHSADLSDADLSYAALSGADLRGADLSYANLSGANLSGAYLSDADLSGANLSYAKLRATDLTYANLRSADLSNANLSNAKLSNAKLINVDLHSADLSDADLSGANLSDADLRGADLSYANLSGADLSGCKGIKTAEEFIKQFKKTKKGIVVYKGIGNTYHNLKKEWKIKKNSIITENVNPCVTTECGCGVNFGTLEWIDNNLNPKEVWECLIEWDWLADVVVPYNTNGKARCSKLRLIKKVE